MFSLSVPTPTLEQSDGILGATEAKEAIRVSQQTYPSLSPFILRRVLSLLLLPHPHTPAFVTSNLIPWTEGQGSSHILIFCCKFLGLEGWDDISLDSAPPDSAAAENN